MKGLQYNIELLMSRFLFLYRRILKRYHTDNGYKKNTESKDSVLKQNDKVIMGLWGLWVFMGFMGVYGCLWGLWGLWGLWVF